MVSFKTYHPGNVVGHPSDVQVHQNNGPKHVADGQPFLCGSVDTDAFGTVSKGDCRQQGELRAQRSGMMLVTMVTHRVVDEYRAGCHKELDQEANDLNPGVPHSQGVPRGRVRLHVTHLKAQEQQVTSAGKQVKQACLRL